MAGGNCHVLGCEYESRGGNITTKITTTSINSRSLQQIYWFTQEEEEVKPKRPKKKLKDVLRGWVVAGGLSCIYSVDDGLIFHRVWWYAKTNRNWIDVALSIFNGLLRQRFDYFFWKFLAIHLDIDFHLFYCASGAIFMLKHSFGCRFLASKGVTIQLSKKERNSCDRNVESTTIPRGQVLVSKGQVPFHCQIQWKSNKKK